VATVDTDAEGCNSRDVPGAGRHWAGRRQQTSSRTVYSIPLLLLLHSNEIQGDIYASHSPKPLGLVVVFDRLMPRDMLTYMLGGAAGRETLTWQGDGRVCGQIQ
jgi:hypothetical protein